MVEARTYSDSEGTFGKTKKSSHACPKCSSPMTYSVWESSCGGYEDEKHECTKCPYFFWIDGPDS